jgi:hypothetical protein
LSVPANALPVPSSELIVEDGVVRAKSNPAQALRYGELIGDGLKVEVDPKIALKKSSEYRLIGKSIRRVDIPGKVTGEFTYIHDVRVPGMLHARVIRSDLNEAHIDEVDLSEARKVHGYVQTVRKKNFLAVVARSEWAAIKAARAVRVYWRPGHPLPDQGGMFDYWRRLPVAKEEITQTAGDAKSRARNERAARQGALRLRGADARHHRPVVRGGRFQGRQAHGVDLVAGDAFDAARALRDHRPAARRDPPGVRRGRGLLRPQRHRGRRRRCVAHLSDDRQAGARAMVARRRDRALAQEPAAQHGPRGGPGRTGNVVAWNGDFYIALNQIVAFKPLDFPLLAAMESGLPRPGNWVGFLFQNSGQPYQFPNIRVNTKHISETFFRSSHLRSPAGSRTASPTSPSWTSSPRPPRPIRRSSACATSRTIAPST